VAAEGKGRGALKVNVVTPRGPIATESTDGVTAPGALGELEVLPGHVPYLTQLMAGVLTLGDKGARQVLAIGPGFLSVDAAGEVQILVEQAVAAADVDLAAARQVVSELGPKIKDWKQELGAEYKNLKARLDWGRAQLDASARIR
jgi:F-type H+-transporting ATPase subunit epsilon